MSDSSFNYNNPDYTVVFKQRADRLVNIRKNPHVINGLKKHYSTSPWNFVDDWGATFDPRNIERGLISSIPMVCWTRQMEYMEWVYGRWRAGRRGFCEKSRDCGVSWLSVGFACSMFLFVDGFTTGFGSRKEELVDRRGDPKSIFEKARFFLDNIPVEFLPDGWNPRVHSSHMRIINPETNATITGESGDEIGRGGRTSVYFVDEAAFVERQERVDAALSQNTNCQIDVSTPNGPGNNFARKRVKFNNTDALFIFDWRDDPRKNQTWYDLQVEEQDEITVAQEIDRDYNASSEDAFIPAKWVVSAIDAHERLGFEPMGIRVGGFDPADVGDAKAFVMRYGPVVMMAEQLKIGNITDAIPWAFEMADVGRADVLSYDGDGMGAPAMKLALQARSAGRLKIIAYHGSAGVLNPNQEHGSDKKVMTKKIQPVGKRNEILHAGLGLRTNADQFLNFRSQTWTWVRERFEATHNAVQRSIDGKLINVNPEHLISLSSKCRELTQLQSELSSPKRLWMPNGRIKVESKADMRKRGVTSPNLADGLIIAFATKSISKSKQAPIKIRQRVIQDQSVGY